MARNRRSTGGTQLAYVASPRGLSDLTTGQTRTIALCQLGAIANLLNATIGWLGDGWDIAIVPAPTAWDLVGRPPRLHWCATTQLHAVIVFVHVSAACSDDRLRRPPRLRNPRSRLPETQRLVLLAINIYGQNTRRTNHENRAAW